jgi:hypothetical protein
MSELNKCKLYVAATLRNAHNITAFTNRSSSEHSRKPRFDHLVQNVFLLSAINGSRVARITLLHTSLEQRGGKCSLDSLHALTYSL